MNNQISKKMRVLFIDTDDYTALNGAQLYSHKLMTLINHHFDAEITQYSYDMCNHTQWKTSPTIDNVKIIYPSPVRNFMDQHMMLKWAFTNLWNNIWRARRQISKIASTYDLIIDGTMVLYSDRKIMRQNNFILIQHQCYDFVKFKHYGFWTWFAVIITYIYGTRDCFKRAKNMMLYTQFDKDRILKDTKAKFDRNIFIAPLAKFTIKEIDDNWTKRSSAIKQNTFLHDCIYIGRISKQQKRVDLLNSVAKLSKLNIACVGDGTYAKKMREDKAVKFYGVVSPDKIADMYIKSKCSIILSNYEGMSGSITEALATGTPVITTVDNESARYMRSKVGNAVQIISAKLKGKKLAKEIESRYEIITKNMDEYNAMSRNCVEFAKSYLSIESFEKSWIDAIKFLTSK